MRKYMKEYIDSIDKYLKLDKKHDIEKVTAEHLIKIGFFQHERFIHLCVTLMYALFCIIFSALIALSYFFAPIAAILYVFLIFYIFHYFLLENGVQYMYKQYDELKKLGG